MRCASRINVGVYGWSKRYGGYNWSIGNGMNIRGVVIGGLRWGVYLSV